jgi:hypothetical protein
MPIGSIPQLIVGPHDTASLILSDSIFESGQITLNGIGTSGIALDITSTDDFSIQSLGGLKLSGNAHILSANDVSIVDGTAALVVEGGVYIDKKLYVDDDICLSGNIQVGITNQAQGDSNIFIGAENDINSWKISRIDGGLHVFKYDPNTISYALYMKLEDSVC